MTVRELFVLADAHGIADEELDEVQAYLNMPSSAIERGVCAMCKHRKTDVCPWPQSAKIAYPICLTFKKKKLADNSR